MDDTVQYDMVKDVADDGTKTVMSCQPNIGNKSVEASSPKNRKECNLICNET